jgi:hypothetical protein
VAFFNAAYNLPSVGAGIRRSLHYVNIKSRQPLPGVVNHAIAQPQASTYTDMTPSCML